MKSLNEIYNSLDKVGIHGDKGTTHCYIDKFYEEALAPYRTTKNGILEIGVSDGCSIKLWREYFPYAKIYGVDTKKCKLTLNGYTHIQGNAIKKETYNNISNLDIVIDDGSHKKDEQIATFKLVFPLLNPGGIYIIEDIQKPDEDCRELASLHPSGEIYDFRKIKKRWDDVIIKFTKEL